jgi:hypothetical protein
MSIIIGTALVVVGGLVVYGSVTGRLAQMMGAIIGIGNPSDGSSKKATIPGPGGPIPTPFGKGPIIHIPGTPWSIPLA